MPESTTATAKRRDPTIDGLKLVAAGFVVMIHTAMQTYATPLPSFSEQVAYSGLYFFFLVAGFFHGALGTRGPKWLGKRLVRLAVPYYVWSFGFVAFWTLVRLVHHYPNPFQFPDPVRFLFFAGASEVLWSLPWLFACALLAELFARTPTTRRILLAVAFLVQLGVWLFLAPSAYPNYAIRQFIAGGRWVAMYVAGMELRAFRTVKGAPLAWMLGCLGAAVAAGTVAIFAGPQPTTFWPEFALFFLNGAVAIAALAGARAGAKWLGVSRLAWGGDYLLGVYVSHSMCLSIVIQIWPAKSMPEWLWLPFGWTLAFGAALGVTHLLLSSRWTRLTVT